MAEYIKRETVLEHAEYDNNYRLIIPAEAIKATPTADIAPVVHGRWFYHTLIDGHIHAECSECHKIRIIDNFCPNCGAKMDGGDNDDA